MGLNLRPGMARIRSREQRICRCTDWVEIPGDSARDCGYGRRLFCLAKVSFVVILSRASEQG